MKYKKTGIYLMTVLFLAAAIILGALESEGEVLLTFLAVTEEGTEEIQVWEKNEEEFFVFLPSYAELSQLQVKSYHSVWLDGRKLKNGMSCDGLQLGRPYELTDGRQHLASVTFLRSGEIPAMFIDTVSGTLDHIHEKKDNKETSQIRLYDAAGGLCYSGRTDSIKIRGNSTINYAKKSYGIKLSSEADLLGMGRAQNWILLANAIDPSYLRNKMALDLAMDVGLPYSPENRWTDVYLNGEYAGLYLLSERNEIHPSRVSISENGGFLTSVEFPWKLEAENLRHIRTDRGTALRIHASAMADSAVAQVWRSVENAIFAGDGIDADTGKHWTELIDLDSWAKKYLIEEVFGNVDGGRASQFFYLDGNDPTGRVFAGPVWDYDLALSSQEPYQEFGETPFRDEQFEMFYVKTNPESFYYPLCRDPIFLERVAELYEKEFMPRLEALTDEKIDRYAKQISAAAEMDQTRWGRQDAAEQTEYIKKCLAGRTKFLNEVLQKKRDFITVSAHYVDRYVDYIIIPGAPFPELPEYEDYTWRYEETGEPVDFKEPVWENTEISLVWNQ